MHATKTLALICLLFTPVIAPNARAASPVERANKLLAHMTVAEKISLAADGGAGIPRLGIPGLAPTDGPNGVRLGAPGVTAFPNAEVVAASWDTSLAQAFGKAMGAEASGKGFNILLGPTVNILRVPEWGRAAETLGEDPYLAGQIVAAEIRGIQSQRVIAQVKHFAANNQEIQRIGNPLGSPPLSPAIDVAVSERALQEIYFPAFKAAVQEGEVASVMCSYPRINGIYACENPYLLGTLKNAWGFPGFVGPDAILAVRNTLAAIEAGTDNFQLGGIGAPPEQVLAQVPAAKLDDMARRILTAIASVGLLGRPNTSAPDAVVSTPAHQDLAREIATAGSVLLKNDAGALPLGGDVGAIAVVGYDAGPGTQTMEGGSASVVGGPVVTPLSAIMARADVTVTHAPGTLGVVPLSAVPSDVLSPSSGSGPGLSGTYYATMDLSGSPVAAFVSPTIDSNGVLVPGSYSARWTGTLIPSTTGLHRFALRYAGVVRLFIDGQLIASGDSEGLDNLLPGTPPLTAQGTAMLTAGTPVPIVIEYSIGSSFAGSGLHFGWQPPDPALLAEAVTAASAAEVAVVFVNDVTSEGMDRTSLALPGDQDRLIEAVAAVNPRTIVVLHTAGPVLMPWLAQVAGVIEAWYPGQESGNAIAAVLFGDADPSGRLPMTFPASESQGPVTQLAQYPGVDGVVHYDEDIFVGYRYYDRFAQEPLFPFGFGLSYTSFSLDDLRVTRRRGGTYTVSVRVTNTGSRTGAAVVQLYVGFPDVTGEPPNQLKGFARVALKPGRRRRVKMRLNSSSFASWSTADAAWAVQPGEYRIRVGTSSRDLPLQTSVVPSGSM
jgi:beta-glucosidase